MADNFNYKQGTAVKALELEDYYVWDCSVIKADGKYHMFSSRWPKEMGFGWNWLFNAEVIHCVSDTPEGPYKFVNVALPRRGREYFDGMNTHNTSIHYHDGKYYLYYMGTTYGGEIPSHMDEIPEQYFWETWNRKRIGVAVADDINGEFVRRDMPLLEPRDCTHWDCTMTTNPTVAILPDGKTYMIYKSRSAFGKSIQLGIAVADSPDGKFERLSEEPILEFDYDNFHIEDPFLWYDRTENKFCLIAKNESDAVTGECRSGFYAQSDDCIHFEIAPNPKAYSRKIKWQDGREAEQVNLERPSLLFDDNGEPTHLFCASGNGEQPYLFKENTYIVCMKLEKKD